MAAKNSAMKQKSRTQTKTRPKDVDMEWLAATPPWEWPKNPGEKFQEVLTDVGASASDRLLAAEMAGDTVVVNDEMVEILMGILGRADEAEELRAQTAISLGPALESAELGDFDDEIGSVPISEEMFGKIQRFLQVLYHEQSIPKLVRRRILEASVRAQQDWHVDAIREAYARGDRDWKLTAVFAMRYVRGFEPEILEELKSTDEEIHIEAVHAAGSQEVDAAWAHLWGIIHKPSETSKDLLLAAILAIGNIRQDTDTLEMLNDLVDSKDQDISEAADEALSMAGAYTEFDEDAYLKDEDASGWIN